MEDIEDMFKNEGDEIAPRLAATKRKIIKKAKVKKQEKAEVAAAAGGEEKAAAEDCQQQCDGPDLGAAPGT
jgi:threonylcarbamoyladenosine tRNA methylthiotransferase CDKAL1|tara:strand:- start:219 stop:431 length:213 start_codon:yes stop_codon:yes gene_type:complete